MARDLDNPYGMQFRGRERASASSVPTATSES